MRRVPLLLLTFLPFTTMASAQTVTPFDPTRPTTVMMTAVNIAANPEIVVTRLMTFDRDSDGRIVKSELPERMQNLLAADTSGDAALDRAEIRALARPVPVAAAAATVPGFRGGGGGGYTFGDQVSLSTRSHVEGALDDLRLPTTTHNRALAIVKPFMDRLEADASAVLMKEVEGVLSPGQLQSFRSAIDSQLSTRTMPSGPTAITRSDGSTVHVFLRRGPDLAQLLNIFGLSAEAHRTAQAALEGFKARIRPADADRSALLDELDGVLSDEERENFGAALQRRPLVKAAGFAGVVSGVVPFQRRVLPGDVVSPAILRPQVLEP